MGEPSKELRQCPLALDKWRTLVVAEYQLALGLILHTRRLPWQSSRNFRHAVVHAVAVVKNSATGTDT